LPVPLAAQGNWLPPGADQNRHAAISSDESPRPDTAPTASASGTPGAHGFRVRRERCRGGYAFGFSWRWICDRLGRRSPDAAPAAPAATRAVGFGVGPDKPGRRLL